MPKDTEPKKSTGNDFFDSLNQGGGFMPTFGNKSKKLFDGTMEPKLGDELPASQPKPKMKKVEEPASFGSGPPAFGSKIGKKNNFDVLKGSPDKKQDSPDPAPQKR